jgi:HKD family nuclease
MELITNSNQGISHEHAIIDSLKWCDKAYFAVAFLKYSGLELLLNDIKSCLKRGCAITIIAGQNFALTEPNAISALYKIFQSYPKSKLYLAKALSGSSVFHTKIYLFEKNKNCRIISGSANITNGGLKTNCETSLAVNTTRDDVLWNEAIIFFNKITGNENADEVSPLIIKTYETYYNSQKDILKNSKPVPKKAELSFDESTLARHLSMFKSQGMQDIFKKRSDDYKMAKKVLDTIADTENLSKREFDKLLDKLVSRKMEKLWRSGGLDRNKTSVSESYKQFANLVKYIRQCKNDSPVTVFNEAKRRVDDIKGASVNYITEIMTTYNNNDFAILNKNPVTVLTKKANMSIKPTPLKYNGDDYLEFCLIIKEISSKYGFKNMLEADSFFNEIYWKIRQKDQQ